jgi:hypothetical protein
VRKRPVVMSIIFDLPINVALDGEICSDRPNVQNGVGFGGFYALYRITA